MVNLHLAGLPAGEPSLIQHLYEIAPVLVIQQGREIAGRPEFVARFILLANAFKRGVLRIDLADVFQLCRIGA